MEFCSNCGTRLINNTREKSQLYCIKCKRKFESSEEIRNDHRSNGLQNAKKIDNNEIVILDKKALKLRTLPRVDADCFKCNGKKAETLALNLGSEDNSQQCFSVAYLVDIHGDKLIN